MSISYNSLGKMREPPSRSRTRGTRLRENNCSRCWNTSSSSPRVRRHFRRSESVVCAGLQLTTSSSYRSFFFFGWDLRKPRRGNAHRGKGYAKAVVSCMARKLHAQGFPVYCNIEEENTASYRLFKSLGFIEDPSYRAAWSE
ncbi:hypothetical protein CRUP_012373 [Coryphaenoides rupestris]|nr:hypothetical protein CRUP_012373 [Coryphaenoides rupestris]